MAFVGHGVVREGPSWSDVEKVKSVKEDQHLDLESTEWDHRSVRVVAPGLDSTRFVMLPFML